MQNDNAMNHLLDLLTIQQDVYRVGIRQGQILARGPMRAAPYRDNADVIRQAEDSVNRVLGAYDRITR